MNAMILNSRKHLFLIAEVLSKNLSILKGIMKQNHSIYSAE